MNWKTLLAALVRGEDLTPEQAAWAMRQTVTGAASPAQIAGLAVGLRAKGETAAEVSGFAQAMAEHMQPMPRIHDATDVVGTGGDGADTVNISTMAAIVTAGAGVPVVKHGNRAASSTCGAADVLETVGIAIEASAEQIAADVTEIGIGFCFARRFHPGLRHAAAARQQLGIPTSFNFLGPLSNPAQPRAAAVGCADARMAPILADVLAARGASALVLRGDDGLDEFTTTTATAVWAVGDGVVAAMRIDAADLGLARARPVDLAGGDATANAATLRAVLDGAPGPVRDATLLNAAAAIAAYRGFGPEAPTAEAVSAALRAGLEAAAVSIDTGAAAAVLHRWIAAHRG
ncbi:MAG: anthranilate phosphoribosyltransferase [Mycobacteriales bacterium]